MPRPSSSGGGIRTRDLRVMSPTSYLTAPPRVACENLAIARGALKLGAVLRSSLGRRGAHNPRGGGADHAARRLVVGQGLGDRRLELRADPVRLRAGEAD